MTLRSTKLFKVLFLLTALFGLNICSSEPSESAQIHDLRHGNCHHKYCGQKRETLNTSAALKHKVDLENFGKKLEKYEQNKGRNRGLIALGSLALGGMCGFISLNNAGSKPFDPKDFSCLKPVIYGAIPGFLAPFIAGLLIHRFYKPSEPTLCLTRECFIAGAISTVRKYQSQTKFDVLWWLGLDNSNLHSQIPAKFGHYQYPFRTALERCIDLLRDYNRAEEAYLKLLDASIIDGSDLQVRVSQIELEELRKNQRKLSIVKTMIESSYGLANDKLRKQEEEARIEAENRANFERMRRQLVEQEADWQRRQAENSEKERIQAKLAEEQRVLQQARIRAEQEAKQKAQNDAQAQQKELDYWKNKQKQDQKAELDRWNKQKIETDPAAQQKELDYWKKKQEDSQKAELERLNKQKAENDAKAQQKELDYWKAQKEKNDAKKMEEIRIQQQIALSKDLERKHNAELKEAKARKDQEEKRKKQEEIKRKNDEKLAADQANAKAAQQAKSANQENVECAICLSEPAINPKRLACGHSFCKNCINDWEKRNKTCPTCRADIK